MVAMTLSGCAEPILETSAIPPGIRTGELVFHRTNWFECAVAVYRLDEALAKLVRAEGLAALPAATEEYTWATTPAQADHYDMSVEAGNRETSMDCLKGAEPYSELFAKYLYGQGGFYTESGNGGTSIIAPTEGLLFVGGYQ